MYISNQYGAQGGSTAHSINATNMKKLFKNGNLKKLRYIQFKSQSHETRQKINYFWYINMKEPQSIPGKPSNTIISGQVLLHLVIEVKVIDQVVSDDPTSSTWRNLVTYNSSFNYMNPTAYTLQSAFYSYDDIIYIHKHQQTIQP